METETNETGNEFVMVEQAPTLTEQHLADYSEFLKQADKQKQKYQDQRDLLAIAMRYINHFAARMSVAAIFDEAETFLAEFKKRCEKMARASQGSAQPDGSGLGEGK